MTGPVNETVKALWLPVAMFLLFSAPPDFGGYLYAAQLISSNLDVTLPQEFGIWSKLICLVIWMGVGQAAFSWIERKLPAFDRICEKLKSEISSRYRRLINLFYHEQDAARQAAADRRFEVLEALQKSLSETFRPIRPTCVDVTYLQPVRGGDGVERLYITAYANDFGRTPEIVRRREGFRKGVGYAGVAWETGQVHAGNKKIFRMYRDPRFAESPGDDGAIQAYLAIPVYRPVVHSKSTQLQGVLCISSDRRRLFPSSGKQLRELVLAIDPLIELLTHVVHHHPEPTQLPLPIVPDDYSSRIGSNAK